MSLEKRPGRAPNSHLEQADTGLETLNSGVSATLLSGRGITVVLRQYLVSSLWPSLDMISQVSLAPTQAGLTKQVKGILNIKALADPDFDP